MRRPLTSLLLTVAACACDETPQRPPVQLASPSRAPEAVRPPLPRAQARPDGPWRQEFEQRWREQGRRMATERSWLATRRIVLLAEPEIPAAYVEQTRAQLTEALRIRGAVELQVEPGVRPLPGILASCVKEHVLDAPCYDRAVVKLREADPAFAGKILFVITEAAIESDPSRDVVPFSLTTAHGSSPKVKSVPPGGQTSQALGYCLVSEFWDLHVPQYATEDVRQAEWRLRARKESSTAAHELDHVLGMPHHPDLENPGFADPPWCVDCHPTVPSHEGSPHPECTMLCGGGDDQAAHFRKHGTHFGLCDKCLTAVRSLVAGIEGR